MEELLREYFEAETAKILQLPSSNHHTVHETFDGTIQIYPSYPTGYDRLVTTTAKMERVVIDRQTIWAYYSKQNNIIYIEQVLP